LGLRKFTRKM